ncbi:MAG TPA: putative sporulation protein YtxC [Clostridiales bacterium]|nr:putative sporulation protein YtxC [Clostridiales bacterium]
MEVCTIGLDKTVKQTFIDKIKALQSQGIYIDFEVCETENLDFCRCRLNIDKHIYGKDQVEFVSEDLLKQKAIMHISDVLSDVILEDMDCILINRILNSEYCYFTKEERQKIGDLACKVFNGSRGEKKREDYKRLWKDILFQRLLSHFDNSDRIIVDGFIRFRMKDFMQDIGECVAMAVDEYLIEREYNDFIKLLRYFVEIQEPKFEEVHVLVGLDRKYTLLNSEMEIIDNDILEDLAKEISNDDISHDDLLISSLITIAPNKIIIHNKERMKNQELIDTINNVFYGRVNVVSTQNNINNNE